VHQRLDPDKFEQVAVQRCQRWGSRAISAARAVLVDGRTVTQAAAQLGMSPPHVQVLKSRFLRQASYTVKIPASEFKRSVAPDWQTLLGRYKPHIRDLRDSGYSPLQISDFLKANELTVPFAELTQFLESLE
jgi:hypothetical protein